MAAGHSIVKNLAELEDLFRSREGVLADLLSLVGSALTAVEPRGLIQRKVEIRAGELIVGGEALCLREFREIWVVSVGKAAPGMARGMLDVLDRPVGKCIVIAPVGSDTSIIEGEAEVHLASHPIPDESGLKAQARLLEELSTASSDTLIIFLLSGGSSALLPAPATGLNLEDEAEVTRRLMNAGATIEELNIVRKHISSIKGGQLARMMMPARVLCLILSDVPGDRLDVVGSGPTVPDPSTFRDAYNVLVRRGVWHDAPARVRERIEAGMAGTVEETPKPGDRVFQRVTNFLIGSVSDACEAAAQAAREMGYDAVILSRSFEGEASSLGILLGSIAIELEGRAGVLYVLGGESTVRVKGGGVGGRNQELALAALTRLRRDSRCLVVSIGTDGVDGPTDAAGAIACSEQIARAESLGLDPLDYLERNDSYTFFKQIGGHIVTGPTGTNVGDVVLVLSPRIERTDKP
ncbi:D-glycerate 2-kinase [Candidatus Calditenuaceae archaeon HR02]|nr:D-glycerate 2-kinase [Candidatus Calditenuaceae archaeon HR02]